jgi:hypothetical protein
MSASFCANPIYLFLYSIFLFLFFIFYFAFFGLWFLIHKECNVGIAIAHLRTQRILWFFLCSGVWFFAILPHLPDLARTACCILLAILHCIVMFLSSC